MVKESVDVELSRTVRFAVSLAGPRASDVSHADERSNSFAAWPSMQGLGAHYEMIITVRGKPDPLTGYLMNIAEIDGAVRQHVLPLIESAVRSADAASPGALLRRCMHALIKPLQGRVQRVRWRLSPY